MLTIALLLWATLNYGLIARANSKCVYQGWPALVINQLSWMAILIMAKHSDFIIFIIPVILIAIMNIANYVICKCNVQKDGPRHQLYMSISMYINFMFVIHQIFIAVHLFLNM